MLYISSGNYLMTWIQHIRPSSTPDTLTMNDLLGYLSLNIPNYTYLYFEATQTLVSRRQTSSVTWYQGISIFACDLGLPWNGRCVECRRSLDLSHTCTTPVRLRLFIKDFPRNLRYLSNARSKRLDIGGFFFNCCMDREEAVCSNENSRFGNRAEAALVRIFALSLENLLSRAHLLPLCACSSLLVCQSIVLKWHHKPF